MGLFRKLECRALMLNGSRTTIALEPQFWMAADKLSNAQSGITWQSWAASNLTKPNTTGSRASVLRVAILEAALR
jgi:predicted DNA-binding ribbon-helix-helix protein